MGKKKTCKRSSKIIPQLETITAVNNIDKIISFNFDKYLIGPYDLSMSLGKPGDFNNKKFIDALSKIKAKT